MRAALIVLLLSGCASNSAAPPDLAAPACTFVLGGDTSGTMECMVRFCREASFDSLDVAGLTPFGPELAFAVDGPFTAGRSYAAADLKRSPRISSSERCGMATPPARWRR